MVYKLTYNWWDSEPQIVHVFFSFLISSQERLLRGLSPDKGSVWLLVLVLRRFWTFLWVLVWVPGGSKRLFWGDSGGSGVVVLVYCRFQDWPPVMACRQG